MRIPFLALSILLFGPLMAQDQPLYHETFRPQFHFSPTRNWTNDPNGLVFANGAYHLFFQHNPFGNVWGHMSWGHAVSKDLVHWKDMPLAIAEEKGIMIFSGSAVVDNHNTAGFADATHGANQVKPLVAIYTGHTDTLQAQHLAYSNDGGISWIKYAGNPVLNLHKRDFRDPNVIWYEPNQEWIMSVSNPIEHQISFYASNNLKDWTLRSHFGPAGDTSGVWECPDLMQVPIAGEKNKYKWVLFTSQNSRMQYFVGTFDGHHFKEDFPGSGIHKQDHGTDYYAAVAYHNTKDKQPISIGWVNNWEYANAIPTYPWKSAMSIPRALSVKQQEGDWILLQQPVKAFQSLRGPEQKSKSIFLTGTQTLPFSGTSYEITFSMQPAEHAVSGIRLFVGDGRYAEIGYDQQKEQLYIDRSHTPNAFNARYASINRSVARVKTISGKIDLRLFVDASLIELYTADGAVVFTAQVFPDKKDTGLQLFSEGAGTVFDQIRFWPMKSIR